MFCPPGSLAEVQSAANLLASAAVVVYKPAALQDCAVYICTDQVRQHHKERQPLCVLQQCLSSAHLHGRTRSTVARTQSGGGPCSAVCSRPPRRRRRRRQGRRQQGPGRPAARVWTAAGLCAGTGTSSGVSAQRLFLSLPVAAFPRCRPPCVFSAGRVADEPLFDSGGALADPGRVRPPRHPGRRSGAVLLAVPAGWLSATSAVHHCRPRPPPPSRSPTRLRSPARPSVAPPRADGHMGIRLAPSVHHPPGRRQAALRPWHGRPGAFIAVSLEHTSTR